MFYLLNQYCIRFQEPHFKKCICQGLLEGCVLFTHVSQRSTLYPNLQGLLWRGGKERMRAGLFLDQSSLLTKTEKLQLNYSVIRSGGVGIPFTTNSCRATSDFCLTFSTNCEVTHHSWQLQLVLKPKASSLWLLWSCSAP